MSLFNPFAIGFFCVAAASVVAVDYTMEAKDAGSHPGAYSVSTYLNSYGIRVDGTFDSLDKARRQAVEARTHLPMEPAGWQRTEWDIGAIDMTALTAGMDIVQSMAANDERRRAIKLANYEAWEYRKGDQLVRMSASFQKDPEPSQTAIAGQLSGMFRPIKEPEYRPYTVIGNVPFLEIQNAQSDRGPRQTLLEARISDDILIAVAAQAAPEDLHALLAQIDFTNLNLMSSAPVTFVGPDAPVLTQEQEVKLASAMARALNAGASLPMSTDEDALTRSRQLSTGSFAGTRSSNDAGTFKRPETSRLQLSGGRACTGETSRLCNN